MYAVFYGHTDEGHPASAERQGGQGSWLDMAMSDLSLKERRTKIILNVNLMPIKLEEERWESGITFGLFFSMLALTIEFSNRILPYDVKV